MKFFAQTFVAIVVLVSGFFFGIRYQAGVESRDAVRTLARIQDYKISELQKDALRLRTLVRLREFLDEVRIRLPRSTVNDMAHSIFEASDRYGVQPEVILAVIRIESAFDTDALSHKGAIGLMQLLPSTAQEVARELRMDWPGEQILRDPSANIEMGTYYLTKLLSRFDDLSVALTAYNHGPTRVSRLAAADAGLPLDYSKRVLSHYTP